MMTRTRTMRRSLTATGKPWTPKADIENHGQREDVPLTGAQQAQVVDAIEFAMPLVRKFEKTYPKFEFVGDVGLRIVRHIRDFDEARTSLKTWAWNQASFACRDVLRLNVPDKARFHRRLAKVASLATLTSSSLGGPPIPLADMVADDAPPVGHEIEADDALPRLLRGLGEMERASVYSSIVDDVPLRVVGAAFGVSESRMSQLRTDGLAFLRDARARDYPEYARGVACP